MTELRETPEGTLLWEPSADAIARARLTEYMAWLAQRRGEGFADYAALWEWSVTDVEAFWRSICDFFEVTFHQPASAVLSQRAMPGAKWFPGATLNYAEHALKRRGEGLALIFEDEAGVVTRLTHGELAERVARVRAGMRGLGVARGDRVVAYMPNNIEALVAFLASASLG